MSAATRVLVLGAGRVGGLIARDLAADPMLDVSAADRCPATLAALAAQAPLSTRTLDLADTGAVAQAVAQADLVVGAAPGALGYATLALVIEAGKPVVDISFMPEDPLALDERARARGAVAVVDCGVAPGLSNWFVGRSCAVLDQVELVEILVGGLPFRRTWPYEYRAVFSPADVIEEYTRPCRMRENGVVRVVPALTGQELVDFAEVGTLEAFNTDGLRTLLDTIPAPTLREKTLRFPGHAEKMRMLRDSGFFDTEPLELGDGTRVVPRRLAHALLVRAWTLAPGDEEFTLLRVVVEGRQDGAARRHVWELFDRTDRASGATSMARTTGFPCAIAARLLAQGRWGPAGVHPPERLGRDAGLTQLMLDELAGRGVRVQFAE